MAALAVTTTLAGCNGTEPRDGEAPVGAQAAKPADVDFEAPDKGDLARDVVLGDQSDQWLSAVAASGDRVVAVGGDSSLNTTLPLFLTSGDAGKTWQRAYAQFDTDGGEEWPSTVAAAGEGFVAFGEGADNRPAMWTSDDGVTWTRRTADRRAFAPSDAVNRIRRYGDAWYAVGTSWRPRGDSTSTAVLWTSTDGRSWSRYEIRGHGVEEAGSSSGDDVAVVDGQVVVAGGVEDPNRSEQPNRIEVWRSRNSGRTWSEDATPDDFAGDYRAYVRSLVVEHDRLVMSASGDGLSEESWDGVVMTSRGRTWTKTGTPMLFSSPAQEQPSSVFRVGSDWVMTANTSDQGEDAVVGVAPDVDSSFAEVNDESLTAAGAQRIADGVATAGDALLVGSTQATGSGEAAIWRVHGSELSAVELPAEAAGGRPSAYVESLVAAGKGFVAVGTAAQSPVAWSSTDFGSWTARGLAGRTAGVPVVDLAAAVRLPSGDVLAVGDAEEGVGQDLTAWRQHAAGRWSRVQTPAFSVRSENGYGSLTASDVIASPRGVVVVADAYVNGNVEAHPLVASADAGGWRAGRGAYTSPLSSADSYYNATPYPDFRAPGNGYVHMATGVDTGTAFVVGGYRGPSGSGVSATVWRSLDGQLWNAPVQLPSPPHAYQTAITSMAQRGHHVVATGTFQESLDSTESGWVSWVSKDDGRSWRLGQVVATSGARVETLLAVPGGYLAVGATGSRASEDVAAWTSRDGRTWREADLGLDRGAGPGAQAVEEALVDGKVLRLVASDVPPQGGGYYAASVDLPRP